MSTVFFGQTLTDTKWGLFGVWYRGIFIQHRVKENTRHRTAFHRPTNPGLKLRFRLSPELKELVVWIPYSTQVKTLNIDSNRLTHRLSAWDASFMGRLGHGQVVFRAMRVVRGTVFIRGRCDSVIIIILDTMYFVVSQKSLEIQKIKKTPGHSVSLIVSCVVGGARTCVSS